ncbi:hypothetical protein VF13_42370 [Nostoc linckia z16]|nr:hypothetical protein VF13_42370 [Nostoc linckia z16]
MIQYQYSFQFDSTKNRNGNFINTDAGAKLFIKLFGSIVCNTGLHNRKGQCYTQQQQKQEQSYKGADKYFFKFFDTAKCFKFVSLAYNAVLQTKVGIFSIVKLPLSLFYNSNSVP